MDDREEIVKEIFDKINKVFEDNAHDPDDLYDVDMYITDVKAVDWSEHKGNTDYPCYFTEALILFVRETEPYVYYGTIGLSIILDELTRWASEYFAGGIKCFSGT